MFSKGGTDVKDETTPVAGLVITVGRRSPRLKRGDTSLTAICVGDYTDHITFPSSGESADFELT